MPTNRRNALKQLGALFSAGLGFGLFTRRAVAAPPTPLVKRVVRSPDNTWFTYPHSNGFMPDGRAVVARPSEGQGGKGIDFLSFELNSGASSLLTHVPGAMGYYSISQTGLMLVTLQHGLVVVDLANNGAQRHLLDDPAWTVHEDCDITKDGTRAVITRSHYADPKDYRTELVDIATGKTTIITQGWETDHAHFSPYDESWVCFCDNRPNNKDRLWVWHAEKAPKGKHIFNQETPDGKYFVLGHERAMFNKPGLLVLAYGESPETPRGLYEADFDGQVRLVSESNSDFHVNESRDGRWAVVTAQGKVVVGDDPRVLDLKSRPNGSWLTSEGSYGDSDVTLVNLKTGARQFLYRGANDAKGQPYEVQPSVSPDGKWVLLKDGHERRVLALELNPAALSAFLA